MQNNKNKRRRIAVEKADKIYFDKSVVIETLPATQFKVKVDRQGKDDQSLPPIIIVANLKSQLVKSRIKVIKGDLVKVEVNPEDMYFNQEMGIIKGTIIQRHLS